jgi:hypothetical protein
VRSHQQCNSNHLTHRPTAPHDLAPTHIQCAKTAMEAPLVPLIPPPVAAAPVMPAATGPALALLPPALPAPMPGQAATPASQAQQSAPHVPVASPPMQMALRAVSGHEMGGLGYATH